MKGQAISSLDKHISLIYAHILFKLILLGVYEDTLNAFLSKFFEIEYSTNCRRQKVLKSTRKWSNGP